LREHSFLVRSLPKKDYPGFDKTHSDRQIDSTKLNWSIIYALESGFN
jgi:hypothetical protein